MSEMLKTKRKGYRKQFEALPDPKLKYGLTIKLRPPKLDLDSLKDEDSEMIVTLEYDNCEVYNLFDYLEEDFIKYLHSTEPAELTKYEAFAEAFYDIGLVVVVPRNKQAIVDLTRTITSKVFKEKILIISEANSSLTFIDKYQGKPQLKTSSIEIITKENSSVRLATVQNLDASSVEIVTARAKTAANSRAEWFQAILDSNFTKLTTENLLIGKNSSAKSYGVFLGDNKQQIDITATSNHKGNESYSDMFSKGVLNGNSKAIYKGNIIIDANAFNCDGYQKEETILLSENAIADAIPNLEIMNNEVRCSHGATIGRVDEEQLFYLTSKGINQQEATKMIVEGFFEPVARKLEWPEIFNIIQPLVQEKLA